MAKKDSAAAPLQNLLKRLAFRSGLVKTGYDLLLEPNELLELMLALQRGETLAGEVIEVGVARGKTTVFLNRFLDSLNSPKAYFAVDTFSGFVAEDVEHERLKRGKENYSYTGFSYNSADIWRRNVVENNQLRRVRIIPEDIKKVHFDSGQAFSTALIDVDLYLPTKAALEIIYPLMAPGGTILVDDVCEDGPYEGAHAAFIEYSSANRIKYRLLPPKCGIITRE
ncbi:MAG: TylF/MycF/NovP-related O-methyltransferase [Candidatus Binataceae bacterium]